MNPLLTWGAWLTSSGFGGTAAVLAALLALIGVRRASAIQRENARKDQWWDRLKWSVSLALSDTVTESEVGLEALAAITEVQGFDPDELNFLDRIAEPLLHRSGSGTPGSGRQSHVHLDQGEEDANDPDGR